jgi:hypothetical protein
MSRFFLPSLMVALWILPLTSSGEDAAAGCKLTPVASEVRPIAFHSDSPTRQSTSFVISDAGTCDASETADRSASRPKRNYKVTFVSDDYTEMDDTVQFAGPQQSADCSLDCCDDACCDTGCCGRRGSDSCCGHAGCRGEHCWCNMPQHHFYYPAMHGYYYFRPYHHSHISLHQHRVAGWGGNPKNPYANEVFQRVYEEYRADQ